MTATVKKRLFIRPRGKDFKATIQGDEQQQNIINNNWMKDNYMKAYYGQSSSVL